MTKRVDLSAELLASLEEGAEILTGGRLASRLWASPTTVDVKAIRERKSLSQITFARRSRLPARC